MICLSVFNILANYSQQYLSAVRLLLYIESDENKTTIIPYPII